MLVSLAPSALAAFPYPPPPAGVDPRDFAQYAFLAPDAPLPPDYLSSGDAWKYSSLASGDPLVDLDPHELGGVTGMSVDLAWHRSTGRPDVVLAVLDSGILYGNADRNAKQYLNAGELPVPAGAISHDANADGVFNVLDYAGDPRVADANANGVLDPQDLIRAFSDGTDADGNGYVDDVSGWNTLDDDNDPWDEVAFGHGSGEASDSAAEADNGGGFPGTCPNCMFLPVRVGESFVAHSNDFAEGVLFAIASHASVVQEALGTIDATPLAREAMEYAWQQGVPVVASAADEAAFHHNMPAALEHALVVNSVSNADSNLLAPQGYLNLNGCTNFGANIAVTVSSTSCSSEATGRGAGIVGLLLSHAMNQVDRGNVTRYPLGKGQFAPYALSAAEVRALVTGTASDVDFSTERAVAAAVPTVRYPSAPGWDPIFGYGRLNAEAALARVDAGTIPPEAEIATPSWFETIDPSARDAIEIRGLAAAMRSASYSYTIESGCGESPLAWSTLVASGTLTRPLRDAPLGYLDASATYARCLFALVGAPTPSDFTVSLRLRVTDAEGNVAEHRKTFYLVHDPTAFAGFPKREEASGESSPRFFDLDGDGTAELLVPSSSGLVHAWRADGAEMPGWPVATALVHEHAGPAFAASARDPVSFGGVGIGDVDGDGSPETFAVTQGGAVWCWHVDASVCAGWPTRSEARWSARAIRDPFNTLLPGFASAPVLVDLDGARGLEVVVAGMDRHLYAWHADGQRVDGFPVHLADTTKVQVDPLTHHVTPLPGSRALRGAQILGTPTVADLDGDGSPELVVGTNEEYAESPNVGFTSETLAAIEASGIVTPGNGRVFAVHANGSRVAGWPVSVALVEPEILPYVGEGVPGSAAAADLDGDGKDEIAIFGVAGPAYVLRGDGTSFLGADPVSGKPLALATDVPHGSRALDTPTFPALGNGGFADLLGTGRLAYYAPAIGLGRALDVAFVERQVVREDSIAAWDPQTGLMLPGFPIVTEDLQFLTNPTAVDVDGDGIAEILAGSGGYLLHAFKPGGLEALGFPKFTGQWIIDSPATGDFDGDGKLEIAFDTREGGLYVYHLGASADARREWWSFHHDERNTGNVATMDPLARSATAPTSPGVGAFAALALAGAFTVRRARARRE